MLSWCTLSLSLSLSLYLALSLSFCISQSPQQHIARQSSIHIAQQASLTHFYENKLERFRHANTLEAELRRIPQQRTRAACVCVSFCLANIANSRCEYTHITYKFAPGHYNTCVNILTYVLHMLSANM
jgi:hypothetical protein